ncbi:S-layer homology domain-containing protein [Paenibacillus sp. CAA11]|nr:S-layer homology domain-containing protein [Paenibacillus sp. CAA11]
MLVTLMFITGGSAAFAAETTTKTTQSAVTQSATTSSIFSDVKSGYWAEKHIFKLAAQGIILGDNGKFRPNDYVTQQEAVTIAIRFMNAEGSLNSGAASAKLKSGNYFKPYIALAIQNKLIDENEEVAATGAKESWGEKKATREWIAKILVRALGKESEAKAAAGRGTTFTDNSKISADARGYVNTALDLNLTKGVDNNRFDPQGSVSRAQIAAFFSRAQGYIKPGYTNVFEGVVTSLKDNSLSVYTDGKNRSFTLDNRSVYYTKDSETAVSKDDLKLYTKVMVVDKAGSAAYVETTDTTPQLESTEGSLLRVLNGKLLLLVNNDVQTFEYDANTSFIDQNGKSITPESISNDSTLIVQRETFTTAKKPVIVQVKSGLVNKSGTGTVQSVDTAAKTITVKDASGSEDKLTVGNSSILRYQSQIISLSELKPGVVVSYTVKDSAISTLEVTQSVERTIQGTLISIEGSKLLTYKKSDGTYETKAMVDKPAIVVNGITEASLNDLIADVNGGDKVELTLNPEDSITKIEVVGRQSESLTGLTVVSYDAKLKALTLVDTNKKLIALQLDDKTKVDYNSAQPVLSGIEPLLTKNRKVNVTHVGDRVLSLSVIYRYEGNFVSANTTAKTITIQPSTGNPMVIPYNGTVPSVETYGRTNGSLADVKAGDPVVVTLTSNQDAVQSIALKTFKQLEITSVDTYYSRVTAKADGITTSFYVNNAALLNDAGAVIKVSDLAAGQIINVAFSGQTPLSVQTVKLTYGKVQSADASGITLKTYTGATATFPASAVKVIRGTAASYTVSSLTTTDHVEIRKDADGSTVVNVLTAIYRPFSRYDSTTKEVFVKREFNDPQYRFTLSPETYVHQGDTTLTVQSLKENDNIVLYFSGDKLVEIEKQ